MRTEKLSFLELINAFEFLFIAWKLHAIATTNAFSAVHIATKYQWHKIRIVLESPIFFVDIQISILKIKIASKKVDDLKKVSGEAV